MERSRRLKKESFSAEAQRAMEHAEAAAADHRRYLVFPEHLMIGLLEHCPEVREILVNLGVSPAAVGRTLRERLETANDPYVRGLPLSPRLVRAINVAYDFAGGYGRRWVEPWDLLWGLVQDPDSEVGQSLAATGFAIDHGALRREIEDLELRRLFRPPPILEPLPVNKLDFMKIILVALIIPAIFVFLFGVFATAAFFGGR